MPSSDMLRRVALVRNDVSEELTASIFKVTRINELGKLLADVVLSSPILDTLMMEALSFSETSFLTRVIRHNIPEDSIIHSHRRENLKS
jgi:pantoate kinase